MKKFHNWRGIQNLRVTIAIAALNLIEIGAVGTIMALAFQSLDLIAVKETKYMVWGISLYAASYLSWMAILYSCLLRYITQAGYPCAVKLRVCFQFYNEMDIITLQPSLRKDSSNGKVIRSF